MGSPILSTGTGASDEEADEADEEDDAREEGEEIQEAVDISGIPPEVANAIALKRIAGRRLFREYRTPFDHASPPGPDNVGPYDWQIEFHNAGASHLERLLIAANQVGKSRTCAAEIAIHATGRYPSWWKGRRFDSPVKVWTGQESTQKSRDVAQLELLGPRNEIGTGWIPAKYLVRWEPMQAGVKDVAESIFVNHASGGISEIGLKTYAQEARGFTGEQKHLVWLDELVPMDIYTECLTRLVKHRGIMLVSFTPLEGPSEVVRHFLDAKPGASIHIRNVTWDDAPHLDEKTKAELAATYPEHERATRTKGTPLMGSGAIFPINDEDIQIPPIEIPKHWARLNGLDFGIDHPGAGAFCAWDRDADTFYVYDCYKKSGETPVYHAACMKKHGDWIPHSWPQDGLQREKGSNVALKDQYRAHGLSMLREFAQYPDARGNSREAALIEMYEWMRTGRFKIFSTLTDWFQEKRMYHRKDGKVVDIRDDIISATRYAFMMRRYAITQPALAETQRGPRGPIIGGRRY